MFAQVRLVSAVSSSSHESDSAFLDNVAIKTAFLDNVAIKKKKKRILKQEKFQIQHQRNTCPQCSYKGVNAIALQII